MLTILTTNGYNQEDKAQASLEALRRSSFNNYNIKLLTAYKLDKCEFEQVIIPPLTLKEYNEFSVTELHKYVSTEFCLTVQTDGYVLDPKKCDNRWLEYDYIGAPWLHSNLLSCGITTNNLVGNSGFCLRSKRLLKLTKYIEKPFKHFADDITICVNYYDKLTELGIKFAPVEVAERFSFESYYVPGTFGFHGKILNESKKLCIA